MAKSVRILIVEDESIIAMDLQETLSDEGYEVVAVLASGEDALAFCLNDRPDLILMDVHLQGELNGIETAQQLKEIYNIPSVLLTGHYDDATVTASQRAGVFAYLLKPYEPRELFANLATALTQSQTETALRQEIEKLRNHPLHENADEKALKITTLAPYLAIEFNGTIIPGNKFTRTQREILALLLSSKTLRIDREVIEAELWPESPERQARSSFDATLLRLRKLFNAETGSTSAAEFFQLKNSVLALENCVIDLHQFDKLDNEGSALRRNGDDNGAIPPFMKALKLWQGEFLEGTSSHHAVLAVRHHNTRRVLDISHWLSETFAKQQRTEEQIDVLHIAFRAMPTSDKTVAELYSLLLACNRHDQGKTLLKEFSEALRRDEVGSQQIHSILRRIEQRAALERCSRRGPL